MWKNYSKSEEHIFRELSTNGAPSVTELSKRVNFPTWKTSRTLKHLEIKGIVHHETEDRHQRGRPRKSYELTRRGREILAKEGVSIE